MDAGTANIQFVDTSGTDCGGTCFFEMAAYNGACGAEIEKEQPHRPRPAAFDRGGGRVLFWPSLRGFFRERPGGFQ
jgi:hypothetical protein